MKKIKIAIITLIILLASTAYGGTYYVNGTSGDDNTAGTIGSPWKTIYKANKTLQAGDTVYIRGGVSDYQIYYVGRLDSVTEGIHPRNSGTDANNRITYSVYPGEKVHFVGGDDVLSQAVQIEDKNWIKVTGYDGSSSAMNLKFSNMTTFLYIWSASSTGGTGSDYNEISYCEFANNNAKAVAYETYRGSTLYRNSQYNWIHHCSFHDYGFYKTNMDGGTTFELGNEELGHGDVEQDMSSYDNTAYNVIEDCKFYHGGHHTFGLHTKYNVVRNNHFHNEQWWYNSESGIYHGYRNIYTGGDWDTNHGWNLIEGNRISHAAGNLIATNLGGGGISLSQSNDIIRYNDFYANAGRPILVQCTYAPGNDHEECNSNHIYNNTFMSNGFGATYDLPARDTRDRRPIAFACDKNWTITYMDDNVIKNNLFWKNYQGPEGGAQIISFMWNDGWDFDNCGSDPCGNTIIANNWVDTDGDPKFINEGSYSSPSIGTTKEWYLDSADETSTTDPNLALRSSSGVIDNGTYLTQANGSGSSSTTLIVDDAKYFQDGWANGAGGGASVEADWIAIGTVSDKVQISSINYNTNTITLVSPMTWADNAYVWLYKKSDGEVVQNGTAPDMGAHEYLLSPQVPSPPQNLDIVS